MEQAPEAFILQAGTEVFQRYGDTTQEHQLLTFNIKFYIFDKKLTDIFNLCHFENHRQF